MKITFSEGSVLPNQLKNKVGNTSTYLVNKFSKDVEIQGISESMYKSSPSQWNSLQSMEVNKLPQGLSKEFDIYMDQARLSQYYQNLK